ncbi:MAG TPA: M28 family metallopeptidase [Pyrinomonadaceae bacterium]|nr:M28 family metallopeptidase [Pyrinomonadaceae bacterium]
MRSNKMTWDARRAMAIGFFGALPLLLGGCPRKELPSATSRPSVSVSSHSPAPSAIATAFNGERAMEHAKKQVDFGPRPPDTPELAKTKTYIINELKSYGLNVTTDDFGVSTPEGRKKMTNIIGEIPGETKTIILITSHYDTKFFKDMRFVGANDPAASVGTLLEIARVAASSPKAKVTYRFVFFDGEEAFCEGWDDCGTSESPDHTYGSRHYVSKLTERNEIEAVRALILLDMMGYTKLELGRDTMSTRWLQDIIWQTGRELGYAKVFVDRPEGVGGDDHEPFLRTGIDSVDLIQLSDYQYWHTPQDTIDKISAQSMKIVGDTVLASLPRIAAHESQGQRRSTAQ